MVLHQAMKLLHHPMLHVTLLHLAALRRLAQLCYQEAVHAQARALVAAVLLRRIGVRMRRRAGDAAVKQQARLRRHLAQGWYCQVLDSFYAGRAAAALQAVVRRRAREEVMAARAAVWEERERGHKMLMQRRLEEGQAAVRDRENQTDCLAERDDRLRRFPTKNTPAADPRPPPPSLLAASTLS